MRSGFRVGHLFGISIRVDWSWLIIFLLVTWNLATVFAVYHREWGGLSWLLGASAALLFFASVLAHELAHSLMARAQGLQVRNITLFLFGGMSNIERDPPSPRAEFLIAIVGPLTSVLLGVLFLALASARLGAIGFGNLQAASPSTVLPRLDPLSTLLLWLGPINILVAFFNLLPGFPLDGGRVLRSILWAATNNLRRATQWAAGVGQGFAWLLIVAGVAMIFGAELPLLGSGLVGGLWLAFIGWFLSMAALQSYQQVVIEDLLDDIPVSHLVHTQVPAVPSHLPVSRLAYEYLLRTDDGAYAVTDGNNRVAGVVTLEDVRKVPREEWETTQVREIMTPVSEVVAVEPEEDAAEALRKLVQHDIQQLPVLDDGRIVGFVRRQDLIRWLQMQGELSPA